MDIAGCMESGPEFNFLMNDEDVWERYRWDRSSYPQCRGELSFEELFGNTGEAEKTEEAGKAEGKNNP